MPTAARPRRSVLYMPGSNARALEKARSVPADALIFDLEDAVAPDEKAGARETIRAALAAGGYGGRERIIRINGLDTEWGAGDLEAAVAAGPDAILVPKVSSANDIASTVALLEQNGAPAELALWAMMETAAGILNAAAIAHAHPRLDAFVLGTNDLAKELRAARTRERFPLLTSLSLCLLAARSAGIACIDGVHNAFRDVEGLRLVCQQGREMGFDGKTLIHPFQVAICNEIFTPTEAELAIAERQVRAFEEALREGRAVAVVDGQMIEGLHVEYARSLLAEMAAIRELEAAAQAA